MKEQRRVKKIAIVALIIAIFGVSIAFAAMSQTLTINGSATLDPSSWSVKFDNLSAATIGGKATVVTEPELSEDSTAISSYDITLTKPGDSVTYTFDVVNDGNLNAYLSSYTNPTPVCTGTGDNAANDAQIVSDNLIYTLTYSDGTSIVAGDTESTAELLAGSSVGLKLTIGYNSTATELPENTVQIEFPSTVFVYSQKV